MRLHEVVQLAAGQEFGRKAIEKHMRAEPAGPNSHDRLTAFFIRVCEFILLTVRDEYPSTHFLVAVLLRPCPDQRGIRNEFLFREEGMDGLDNATGKKDRGGQQSTEKPDLHSLEFMSIPRTSVN